MPNALAHETSPYLQQHADNPVDWLPWGEAAFARARAEDKPIFLSIGYSTCHWCHVMAHESFEDAAVAAILNQHFVSVKVDREERPDVDRVYMTYVQALTGHGGWPLSAWLTPALKPFYGGTYFPPENRHGRPGFPAILSAIAAGWRNERDKLVAESERVLGALREHAQAEGRGGETSGREQPLAVAAGEAFEKCFQHLHESFDAVHGGFGGAPKFPRASNLTFLFRAAAIQGVSSEPVRQAQRPEPVEGGGAEAIRMAAATLRAMAAGGIHDHVGGGFHRYSVDEAWFVPHFEKMLYDQAQIAINCLEAKQATGDERFAWLARDIFDYVLRDLTSPEGGFYSAEDADSAPPEATRRDKGQGTSDKAPAHAEGAFYVWTKKEIVSALGADAEFFCAHFRVEEGGNVPPHLDPHCEFGGENILAQRQPLTETAKALSLTPEEANRRLHAALEKLRQARAARPRPHLDDKIIAAWNGLMISALARGAAVPGDGAAAPSPRSAKDAAGAPRPHLEAAIRATEFVERELWDAERGVLFRCWRGSSMEGGAAGRSTTEGFAEDYAFLVQGLLDLYEATFDARWLQWAAKLQTKMDELFWDDVHGGYFNSAASDPNLVLRLKEDYDGAEPAPSSVAALNLLRLGAIFHDADGGAVPAPGAMEDAAGAPRPQPTAGYRERGVRCIEAFRAQWSRAPHALPQMLCAMELALDPPRHVVLVGDPTAADFRALAAVLHEKLGPRRAILRADAAVPWTHSAGSGQAAAMTLIGGRATAYVCDDYACQAPVTEPAELRRRLA